MSGLGGYEENTENRDMGTWCEEPLKGRNMEKSHNNTGVIMTALVKLSLYGSSSLCKICFIGCYKLKIRAKQF
jgi:hypothetical protein